MNAFIEFVRRNKASVDNTTHLNYDKPSSIRMPGKFTVTPEDQSEFKRLYCAAVRETGGIPCAIVETRAHMENCIILADLDFNLNGTERKYTSHDILKFTQTFADIVCKHVHVRGDFRVFITEKQCPTLLDGSFNGSGKKQKDGFHVYMPDVVTSIPVQYAIRRKLLTLMPELFGHLNVTNPNGWDDVLDICVIESNGMILPGCRKKNGHFYDVTHSFVISETGAVLSHREHPFVDCTDIGRVRAKMLLECDLFQRDACLKTPCEPTLECLNEMEVFAKICVQSEILAKGTKKRGRPRESAETVELQIPAELDDDADFTNGKTSGLPLPLELWEQAVVVLSKTKFSESYDPWTRMGFIHASVLNATRDYERTLRSYIAFSTAAKNSSSPSEITDKFRLLSKSWFERFNTASTGSDSKSVITWRSTFTWLRDVSDDPKAKCIRHTYYALIHIHKNLTLPIDPDNCKVYPQPADADQSGMCRQFHTDFNSSQQHILFISSACGTGKTTQEIEFVDHNKSASVVLYGTRRAYSKNVVSRFRENNIDIALYSEREDAMPLNEAQRVMVSVESMHYLRDSSYNIVIIDECEAFVTQLLSPTVKLLPECLGSLDGHLHQADCIVVLDAHMTKRSFDFIRAIARPEAICKMHINTHQPLPRTYECVLPESSCKPHELSIVMCLEIIAELRAGNRAVFPSASLRILKRLFKFIEHDAPDVWSRLQGRFKKYTSETPQNELFHDIEHINDVWSEQDLIAFTGTLSVGIDYNQRGVFDVCFVYGSASSGQTGVDLIQQSFRVRHLNDTRVRVFCSHAITQHVPIGIQKIREEIMLKHKSLAEEYDVNHAKTYRKSAERVITDIENFCDKNGNVSKDDVQKLLKKHMKRCDRYVGEGVQTMPGPLQQLYESHIDNLSHWASYYLPMFEETVRRMGHTYSTRHVNVQEALRGVDTTKWDPIEFMDDDDLIAHGRYNAIASIDHDTFGRLCRINVQGRANPIDIARINKHIFDRECDRFPFGGDERCRAIVFEKIVDHSAEKIHLNLVTEFEDRANALCDISAYRPFAALVQDRKVAVVHIKKICDLLGLRHTYDTERIVPRSNIENNMDVLNAECLEVIRVMRFRDQNTISDLVFLRVLRRINNVIGNWCGTELVDVAQEAKEDVLRLQLRPKNTKNGCLAKVWLSDE